jgi:hypothetical protein
MFTLHQTSHDLTKAAVWFFWLLHIVVLRMLRVGSYHERFRGLMGAFIGAGRNRLAGKLQIDRKRIGIE